MVLSEFAFVGILVVVASLLPIVGIGIASLIRPKKPNPVKQSTYECGIETIGDAWVQFRAQYYIYALVLLYLILKRCSYCLGLWPITNSRCMR